jgi:hypothetical protein
MSNLINWINDPINWYDCIIREDEHAKKIAGLCDKLGIRYKTEKTGGVNLFIHMMDMDGFLDLVNEYTTLMNVNLSIDCITPAADTSDFPQKVDVPQGKALTSEYNGMTLAANRMQVGAVTMMLSDGELTAARITYIDDTDNPDYLSRECSFSGEYITDDYSVYVYAG